MAKPTPKHVANTVIGVVLAILVVSPLSYYTVRSDKYDERFAWRMFSSIRMVRCNVQYQVGPSKIRLMRSFHEAWVNIARRGRRVVLDRMTEKLCAEHPDTPVRMTLSCRHIGEKDNRILSDGSEDLCKSDTR